MIKALLLFFGLSQQPVFEQSFPAMHYDTVGNMRIWIRRVLDGQTTMWTQKIGDKQRTIHVLPNTGNKKSPR